MSAHASGSDARTVLAIETSCDETCAAVVRGREVLANVVASQIDLHARFGGVVPEIASRRHLELVDVVVAQALHEAAQPVDAVAATQGPGLVGALLVGLNNAKARAYAWGLPLVPVDHLLGHVASALLADHRREPPFLCLLASGGHTLLVDVDEQLGVRLLGTTRDDAAGEAFDKGARLLGLGMPGGPALERAAQGGDERAVPFTPAMLRHESLDLSFAGVKTALAVALADGALQRHPLADVAASYQRAIVDTLIGAVTKLLRANEHAGAARRSSLAVVGGVAANTLLRQELAVLVTDFGIDCATVPLRFCGDNAAMIGVASSFCRDALPDAALRLDAYATTPLFRSGTLLPT